MTWQSERPEGWEERMPLAVNLSESPYRVREAFTVRGEQWTQNISHGWVYSYKKGVHLDPYGGKETHAEKDANNWGV